MEVNSHNKGYETSCNTGLTLRLGTQYFPRNHILLDDHQEKRSSSINFDQSFPSLTLGLSSVVSNTTTQVESTKFNQQASSVTAVSSFSNSSVKRERDGISVISGEEVEVEKVSSKLNDDQVEEGGARKKLQLTKEQSFVLEESFKEHSTLNPKQKQALAKRLNLQPRQVEVWFQNRRARTKLKQNEVDCDLLKKCCEALTDDNRRLQKEIQELKALKMMSEAPLYMQFPTATLTMCPSCGVGENSSKSPFSLGTKPHLFSPFTHPSAAC